MNIDTSQFQAIQYEEGRGPHLGTHLVEFGPTIIIRGERHVQIYCSQWNIGFSERFNSEITLNCFLEGQWKLYMGTISMGHTSFLVKVGLPPTTSS